MTITVQQKYLYAPVVKAAAAAVKATLATELAAAKAMESAFVADDKHKFRLVINHIPVDEVISASLTCSIDLAARGWSAVVPFDPLRLDRWALYKPYQYHIASVYLGGKLMCFGRCYGTQPSFNDSGRHVTLTGWSPVADALDSTPFPPYEGTMVNLMAWTTTQLTPFGLTVKWNPTNTSIDKPFKRATIGKTEKIGEHLMGLTRQRNLLMMSDEGGNVIFHEVMAGVSTILIKEGSPPFKDMSFNFDGRQRYGLYTVLSSSPGRNNNATAIDTDIPMYRHTTVQANDADDADMKATGTREASRALANALTIPLPMPTWYSDPAYINLWEPNTLVRIISDSLFIPLPGFDFLVRSVEYIFSKDGTRAVVNVVPPQAYTGLPMVLWV